jgi:hypothetical protein
MHWNLFKLLGQNFLGSNAASTSLKVGGRRARSRQNFYNQSKPEISGSTK